MWNLWKQKWKQNKERLKEKKGMLAIEIVAGFLIVTLSICFLTDAIVLGVKFNTVAQANTYIARTAGIQGGIKYSAPYNFPGGASAYVNKGQMDTIIADNLAKAGIKQTQHRWSLDRGTAEYDYGQMITTTLSFDYRWDFVSNVIPGKLQNTITSKRTVMSEFKYRYDIFQGE